MSLRTTLVLLVLVALAGAGIWWFTRGEHQPPGPDSGKLLPGLQTSEVATITLEAERKDTELNAPVTLARGNGAEWTAKVGDGAEVRARGERVRAFLQDLRDMRILRELSSASRDKLESHGLAPGSRILVRVAGPTGTPRLLELGAAVSASGVAARVDGGWPPVEVDREVLDQVTADPAKWVETRLLPFDAASVQSIRASFPKSPERGFLASREAGQWAIREPALMRSDQGLVMRLLGSLSSLEMRGPFETESAAAPDLLVRYEIGDPSRKAPLVIEIGDGQRGDVVPAREGGAGRWSAVSLAGLELITQPIGQFRSRRLLDVEPADVQDVLISGADGPGVHYARKGGQMSFEPPAEWGWKYLGSRRSLPLDPSAQTDLLQSLCQLEASDFEPGPAFDTKKTVVIRHGAPGAAGAEAKLRFGAAEDGKRPFTRLGEAREGRVRAADVGFLDKPFWELLARQAYTAAWFSLATIEVEEVGKRKVVIKAVGNTGTEPEFILAEPHGDARRRVPREIGNPVADKIVFLTVEKFVGFGDPSAFGLDRPRYVVRWHDSAKSQGVAPDSRTGQWVTWRIAERGPDGSHAGDLDIAPGLVFKVKAADLDPFLSMLEWAGR